MTHFHLAVIDILQNSGQQNKNNNFCIAWKDQTEEKQWY